eukprot:813315-Rhodomonas_salina.3
MHCLIPITLLQRLDLSDVNMTERGATAITDAFTTLAHLHSSLTFLNLSRNYNLCTDCAHQVARVVSAHQQLARLLLVGCTIANKGVQQLVLELQHNTVLTQLDLAANGITHIGAVCISNIIHWGGCRGLVDLVLLDNDLGDKGASLLREELSTLTALQCLCLLENGIRDSGVQKLWHDLQWCTALTHLQLSSSGLGVGSIHQLVPLLMTLSSLTERQQSLWEQSPVQVIGRPPV